MIRILVVCAAGMSSSLLIYHMKETAKTMDSLTLIESLPYTQIDKFNGEFDVLLLGPQIAHLYQSYKETYEPLGIPVINISLVAYGRMDAKHVLQQAFDGLEDMRNKRKDGPIE